MSSVSVHQDSNSATIEISGRFDFNLHSQFRKAYEDVLDKGGAQKFVIDMKNTDYLDSSALGMLLILRDRLGCEKERQEIINCRDDILEILKISNFHKLFKIA